MERTVFMFIAGLCLIFLMVIALHFSTLLDRGKILNADYLRGSWQREGVNSEGEKWWFRYDFEDNIIKMKGLPQFEVEAEYEIVKEVENLLTLHLKNFKGDIEQPNAFLQVAVDKKRGQLTIDSRSGYKPV